VKEEPIEEVQISGPEVCSLLDPEKLKKEEEVTMGYYISNYFFSSLF